jgi:hypothetical protein
MIRKMIVRPIRNARNGLVEGEEQVVAPVLVVDPATSRVVWRPSPLPMEQQLQPQKGRKRNGDRDLLGLRMTKSIGADDLEVVQNEKHDLLAMQPDEHRRNRLMRLLPAQAQTIRRI